MRKTKLFLVTVAMSAMLACGCGSSDDYDDYDGYDETVEEESSDKSSSKQSENYDSDEDDTDVENTDDWDDTDSDADEYDDTEDYEVADSSDEEGDLLNTDFSEYAGTYVQTRDGSTLIIESDGKIQFDVANLCSLTGSASGIYKGIMPITVEDPDGNSMGLEYMVDDMNLVVTDSSWDQLINGESFVFDDKQ